MVDVNREVKFCVIFFIFWGGGIRFGGGGQEGCEQRIEVFVKIQKKIIFFGGGVNFFRVSGEPLWTFQYCFYSVLLLLSCFTYMQILFNSKITKVGPKDLRNCYFSCSCAHILYFTV